MLILFYEQAVGERDTKMEKGLFYDVESKICLYSSMA